MAPISLAILNPIAFVLMEIYKQRENPQTLDSEPIGYQKFKMVVQILKGIIFNPVLSMTILGIIGNIAFKHQISIYIEGLLDVSLTVTLLIFIIVNKLVLITSAYFL